MPRWGRATSAVTVLAADLSPLRTSVNPPATGLRTWASRAALAIVGLGCGTWAAVAALQFPADLPPGSALLLGGVLALPLALVLVRPVAALWMSLLVTALISEVLRAGGDGPVWAPAALPVHLTVLGVVALTTRPPVALAAWALTVVAGAVLVQRMPGMNATADLGQPPGGQRRRGHRRDRPARATGGPATAGGLGNGGARRAGAADGAGRACR